MLPNQSSVSSNLCRCYIYNKWRRIYCPYGKFWIWIRRYSSNFCLFVIPQHIIDFRARTLAQFGSSAFNFARSGFATTPPEALATREATCKACPEWDAAALNNTGRCRKCGCSTWAKLRMATERCPIGKWEAVDKTPE